MNKRIKFIVTTLWILLSRSYDVFATYQYTPDLKHEANPLASVLGWGWMPILTLVSILMAYIIYAYYISTFKKYPLHPQQSGYSFVKFATYLYLGKNAHWTANLYQLPKDIKRMHHVMGNILSRCFVYAGMLTTPMWLLINYTDFYKEYHSAAFIYTLLVSGCLIITGAWFRQQYVIYKRHSPALANQ